jgi:hypothetical protein
MLDRAAAFIEPMECLAVPKLPDGQSVIGCLSASDLQSDPVSQVQSQRLVNES